MYGFGLFSRYEICSNTFCDSNIGNIGTAYNTYVCTRNANTPLKHWSQVLVKFEIKLEY